MDLIDELQLKVIDCDTHVVGPLRPVDLTVSPQYGDKIPHVERDEAVSSGGLPTARS